jgi:hypothetical protein
MRLGKPVVSSLRTLTGVGLRLGKPPGQSCRAEGPVRLGEAGNCDCIVLRPARTALRLTGVRRLPQYICVPP